jgi:thiol-disulfide isomerase/thioredoxin
MKQYFMRQSNHAVFAGLLLTCSFLLDSTTTKAQEHSIEVTIDGLSGDTIFLAHYYGNKMYYADTAVADVAGFVRFDGRVKEECGKYAIVMPGPKFFEFLAVEEDIVMRTSAQDPTGDVVILQSNENALFYDYMEFLSVRRAQAAPHEAVLSDSTASQAAINAARKVLGSFGDEVGAEQRRILEEHGTMLFAKYLNMVLEPTMPEFPSNIVNIQDLQYRWYLNHYWDRVDFTDPRLVRDGSFHQILDRFWTRVLPQIPDSLAAEAHRLIERTAGNDEMFKYITHYITFASESSQVMCMDKVFVDMVDSYYNTGKATWLKPDQLKKIQERADELRDSMCGNQIPNIVLPDLDQTKWESLHALDAKYTVVIIWESTCGHCKKELPKFLELYERWHEKGLEIYAIGNDFDPEPWQDYVRKKEYTDWINVSDNPLINAQDSAMVLIQSRITTLKSLNFRTTFDVFATPKVFLLDRDKTILAKQISAEQLEDILNRLEAME